MEVVVTGIGLISALGQLQSSWRSLLNGESAIREHKPFPDLPALPIAMMGKTATYLDKLTQLVVADALEDAALTTPMHECGVVIGSSRGCQAAWEHLALERRKQEHGDTEGEGEGITKQKLAQQRYTDKNTTPLNLHPSPLPSFLTASDCKLSKISLEGWLDTLPDRAALCAARQIGSQGPVLAPMAACATGIWALAQGFELIQTGQCQQVIAGALEAPITRLTLTGFNKMGALAKTGAYPFDKHREGLVLGEGGAVLVLESAENALRRGVPIYGQLLGFGLSCDAYHLSALAPDRRSATTAVKQCLHRSHLCSAEIDYIHAHGTSTQLNDQNEAQLIQSLFPQGVPVSSTKGATGHTLGASGAIGAAICLIALKYQLLPPCVGLKTPEYSLDFLHSPRPGKFEHMLCFSFGFGGQNAVAALAKTNQSI
ncbi:beta-ketoacyl-ACP synthase [Lyngbya aestuarii]|uniref:beta-ketoacyl-ACP synthase n=1 Tax=Lyngbya aestuarii TaxID=118322 RepID=UPI00403DD1EE